MNILFLCTANLHRSRTAEDYFKSLDSTHTFKSAGLSEKYCTQLCSVELLTMGGHSFN
jgi:protein-tyrosine-phosphatase